jgi:O-antigen/teichoic acid export membrane protein
VLFPYLQEEYGRHKDIRLLKDKLVRSLNCVAMILPVFLVFVFLFMSVIVHYFLPKFLNGILPMMVLIFGFYFMLLKDVPHTILYTINKQKYIAATLGALLLLYVPSIYMLSTHGFGIVSIAFATALVYLSYFTVLFLIGFRHISGAREQFTILLSIAAVYSYAVGSYMLIDRFILLGNALACAAVKMAVFTVVYLPLLLYIEKKEGLIRYMVSLVLRKRDSINA